MRGVRKSAMYSLLAIFSTRQCDCRCGTLFHQKQADPEIWAQIRRPNREQFDLLTIFKDTLKNHCKEGNRHGSTGSREAHYRARTSYRKSLKKGFVSTHDRFLTEEMYGSSQLEVGWTEETCSQLDAPRTGGPHAHSDARRTHTVQWTLVLHQEQNWQKHTPATR